jgi:putative ABC transport system substrate-binding protein
MAARETSRREFATLLGGAAAWPVVARGQSERVRRIGVLMINNPTEPVYQSYLATFMRSLQTLGWTDGRNLQAEVRWSGGDSERARSNAEELVRMGPDLIFSVASVNLAALLRVTHTIPIVFVQVSDPVAQGFVADLVHPGGNITGFSAYEFSMGAKWLDLLKQMVPYVERVGVMFNPDTSPQSKLFLRSIEATGSSFGVKVIAAPVHSEDEIKKVVENLGREPNSGLLLPTDNFTNVHGDLILERSTRYRLPVIYSNSTADVRKGGLMYYGIDYESQFRQAAIYVDRVLNGAKPGDLPVQGPITFRLAINLKAARALGIEVPVGLMLRADEMIE